MPALPKDTSWHYGHDCQQDNLAKYLNRANNHWHNRIELAHRLISDYAEIRFIQPGKPDQNAFIERFSRRYREEVLDAYLFSSIADVQEITDDWLRRYNEIRPHDSLGNLPPALYREKLLATVSPV